MECNIELYVCTIGMGNIAIAMAMFVACLSIQLFAVISDWNDWYEKRKEERDK